MTTSVVTAGPDASFQELVGLMLDHGISGIPIIDATHRPIGIVTEADLVSREAFGGRRRMLEVATDVAVRAENIWAAKARETKAAALMSVPVRTVRLDDLVQLAAARMVTTGVRRLPVVDDDGRVVGIVSRSDILRLFHRLDRLVSIDVGRVLRDPLLVPEDHEVEATVKDGVVVLTGTVSSASHVRLVEAMVREVPGVIDVDSDAVAVDAPSSLAST